MKLEVKDNCPLDNFEPCRQFDCAWFMKVSGQQPQHRRANRRMGDAAMAWLPILMIENAKQGRQTGAAVESFSNEMVSANAREPTGTACRKTIIDGAT